MESNGKAPSTLHGKTIPVLTDEDVRLSEALIDEAGTFKIQMPSEGQTGPYSKSRILEVDEERALMHYAVAARMKFQQTIERHSPDSIADLCELVARDMTPYKDMFYGDSGNAHEPTHEETGIVAVELRGVSASMRKLLGNGAAKHKIERKYQKIDELLVLHSARIPVLKDIERDLREGMVHPNLGLPTILHIPGKEKTVLHQIEKYRQQYEAAAQALFAFNIRLTSTIARNYFYRSSKMVPLADLGQEGARGLLRCIETLEQRVTKFATYATHWIRQHIQIALCTQNNLAVELGVSRTRLLQELRSRVEAAEHVGKAKDMEMTPNERKLLQLGRTPVNLDTPFDDSGDTNAKFVVDPHPSPVEVATKAQLFSALDDVLRKLFPREEAAIRMRYGLPHRSGLPFFSHEPQGRKLREIGKVLGVTRERSRQILNKATAKLRRGGGNEALRMLFQS